MGHMGRSGDNPARGDVLVDTRSGGNHHVIPDPDMADETRLTTDNDASSQMRAPGDTDLGDDYRIFSDHHIMSDLDAVIDLHPSLDPGPTEGATVNGRICSNFNIIVDLDITDLGDFQIFLPGSGKSETVRPDDGAGMDDNTPAYQAASVKRGVGVKDGSLADDGIPADKDTRVEDRLALDTRPAADMDTGVNHGVRRNGSPGFDAGKFAYSRLFFFLRVEEGQETTQRDVRFFDDEEIFPRAGRFRRDKYRACSGGLHSLSILRIGHESEVPLTGIFNRPDPLYENPAVAADASAQKHGDLAESLGHFSHPSLLTAS
jgi:hypothetical protein